MIDDKYFCWKWAVLMGKLDCQNFKFEVGIDENCQWQLALRILWEIAVEFSR